MWWRNPSKSRANWATSASTPESIPIASPICPHVTAMGDTTDTVGADETTTYGPVGPVGLLSGWFPRPAVLEEMTLSRYWDPPHPCRSSDQGRRRDVRRGPSRLAAACPGAL